MSTSRSSPRISAAESGLVVVILLALFAGKAPHFSLIVVGVAFAALVLKTPFVWVGQLWVKIGQVLGKVVPPIILFFIFYSLFVPLSVIYRLVHKDTLGLRKANNSGLKSRPLPFDKESFTDVF